MTPEEVEAHKGHRTTWYGENSPAGCQGEEAKRGHGNDGKAAQQHMAGHGRSSVRTLPLQLPGMELPAQACLTLAHAAAWLW